MSERLSQLKVNESAIIKGFLKTDINSTNYDISRRLMELGVLAGTPVKVMHEAPLGSPIAIQVRGTLISLRREEASCIEIERT